jgi:N-acetylglucosaminyldiphosphoundecaprenol N-acetyl-beta-D-mannosaminyltransferase
MITKIPRRFFMPSYFSLLSVKLCTLPKKDLVPLLCRRIREGKQTSIFTPNTQILLAAHESEDIRRLLARSTLNIPDGIGVRIAARIRGARIESMSGIDLGESLLSLAARSGLRVFFLGAKRGIAKKAAENMCVRHPTLQICGTQHGYFDKSGEENAAVIEKIRSASPDILFVCFGFPAQERWITDNLASLPSVKLAMGLGGSLDVWSGNLRRAPLLIQKAGLEWLWRTVLEPKRARIFLDIPRFLFLNIKKAD